MASLNRFSFLQRLAHILKFEFVCESVHNYVDTTEKIIRKGAQKAEPLCVIPVNMQFGSLLVSITPLKERNYSAPHGAGRAKMRKLRPTLEQFKEEVKGIWSSSIKEMNSDEAPSMYKPVEEVRKWAGIEEEIAVLRSIYSFKE